MAQVDLLQAALAQAELAAGAARDAQLRALAELDNVRKRAQRDIDNAQRYALERFAAELLPARDSLELAAQSAASADSASLIAGQQATLQLLSAAFEKRSTRPCWHRIPPACRRARCCRCCSRVTSSMAACCGPRA
jgi:molecular chaperone GrpE